MSSEYGSVKSSPDIRPISLGEEMKRSYLDYAMSVIVSRALPDVRDGLKPVHRRIIYSMYESGYSWNRPYRKAARVVGDVIGKYHPHGDQSIYEALVRMAQDFSMRAPLVDGQGNFGSVDGDPPAAMRYTEVRMQKAAHALLRDIDKDTVDFRDNYDNTQKEPEVLPSVFPNILINGSGGIAVGMAANIPPHNPGEVIDACIALLNTPNMSDEDLLKIVPGPDFPTGGIILRRGGILSIYYGGRGSITLRGRTAIEEDGSGRQAIIITEIPYQVNKAAMVRKIAELVRDQRIEGISQIRDESDRQGMRVVVELKRAASAEVVLNQLYHHSPLQSVFGAIMLALKGGRPELMSLREIICAFLDFRQEVLTRSTRYELEAARHRAHILLGLAVATAHIDEILALIRGSQDPTAAKEALLARAWPAEDMAPLIELVADPRHILSKDNTCRLSEDQAKAILELRIQRLTALGREEISDDIKVLKGKIEECLDILESPVRRREIIEQALREIREEMDTPRKTEIAEGEYEIEDEDLIESENMVVTVSHQGYIKRTPLSVYRVQRRGGKGRQGMKTRQEDLISRIFIANTHRRILFFSSTGMVYKMPTWRLPSGEPYARGKAMVNLLPLSRDEKITAVMPWPENEEDKDLCVVFATRQGYVRRNLLSDFERIHRGGKIAMKPPSEDGILGVQVCTQKDDVFLASREGRAVRFHVRDLRVFSSRNSRGLRGIRLKKDDEVVSMSVLPGHDATLEECQLYLQLSRAARHQESFQKKGMTPERYKELEALEQFVLTICKNGYGKQTSSFEYFPRGRGAQGVLNIRANERNGPVITAFPVQQEDQIMLMNENGKVIRIPVSGISIVSRSTQGVRLFRTKSQVASVAHLSDTLSTV